MGGSAAKKRAAERRGDPSPDTAYVLREISFRLIGTPDHVLGGAIDKALVEFAKCLAVERARILLRPAATVAGMLEAGRTLVVCTRKEFSSVLGRATLLQGSAAILVPLKVNGSAMGVLAVTDRSPRRWTPDAVEASERVAGMLGAALARMETQSSVAHEQKKRLDAEAETRRLRDQLAHAGRVSMLGELAASLAHELNQPLTAIYTNAQAAQRFLDRKPPAVADASSALHDLGQDCRRSGEVLGRMRQMFRRHETEREALALRLIAEHVLKLLHEDAVARGVDVVLDVGPAVPLVTGDRVQLEQVVMNLLVNALDAVTGVADPRQVVVRVCADHGRVQLAVSDTGKGIAPGDLDRIFEPFFTRKPKGMGMGLAICRTIVEAHGGRIVARNRSERGSLFEISLPARPANGFAGVES